MSICSLCSIRYVLYIFGGRCTSITLYRINVYSDYSWVSAYFSAHPLPADHKALLDYFVQQQYSSIINTGGLMEGQSD